MNKMKIINIKKDLKIECEREFLISFLLNNINKNIKGKDISYERSNFWTKLLRRYLSGGNFFK